MKGDIYRWKISMYSSSSGIFADILEIHLTVGGIIYDKGQYLLI